VLGVFGVVGVVVVFVGFHMRENPFYVGCALEMKAGQTFTTAYLRIADECGL